MGLKSIVEKFEKLLDTDKGRASKQTKAIEALVEKLIEKEAKYKSKLAKLETDRERDKLERKIKVYQYKIKKGRAAIAEMQINAA